MMSYSVSYHQAFNYLHVQIEARILLLSWHQP